ncbi:hypothetical protein N7478_010374 [Penicillium angulare]|uniref:uncharacterized protein n=1 Tax=Penicillium angulare TaxID=116970 RepID=UPI002541827D|nr:uncharacterized protein N7478_010374 [Penicillium angulare]KAJ5267566.1 hypothetical protein N7478_010374 [Penicillium angulare]
MDPSLVSYPGKDVQRMMRKKKELRRSCNLCRTRKIACSGEQICATCRERGVECVYDLEGLKGRPPASFQADAAKSQTNVYPETWYSPAGGSLPPSRKSNDDSDKTQLSSSVAAELDSIYREQFGDKAPYKRNNRFQKRVVEFNRSLATNLAASKGHAIDSSSSSSGGGGASSIGSTESVVGMNYHGFLTLVTLDLVETVVLKFSRLGVRAFFGTGERYYRACMLQDETTTMFDTPITVPDTTTAPSTSTAATQGSPPDLGPLAKYNSHLLAQMVDLWFTHHPLSILLSKSLLMTDLCTNRAKPTLLAVMLADAHEFTKDPEGERQAVELLEWAIGQLHHLKTESPDLTTAQACFFICWYLSCRGQARRAVAYITFAGRTATQLKYKIHEIPITDKTHINGIDRGAVEVEMIQNLWWITFALTLWSFIQMDISFADLLPSRIMQVFPPSSAAECTILQLDRTMGNITSQHAQTASLQSVWLLAHVSSFTAHLYALYPHPTRGPPSIDTPVSHWQDQLIMRMDHLFSQQRNLAAICVDAREAMQDMIDRVDTAAGEDPIGAWLLAQYYTTSIHLLFPRGKPISATSPSVGEECIISDGSAPSSDYQTAASVLTTTIFTELEKAMQGLASIFHHIKTATSSEESHVVAPPAFIHSYVLGLDAIGRALTQILFAQDRASSLEQQFCSGWLKRLHPGLITLHELFNSDALLRDHRWRPVKRQIKYVRKRLDQMVTTEYASGPSTTVQLGSTIPSFSIASSMGAPPHPEESLPWSDWQPPDQTASDPLNLSMSNMPVYQPSINHPLMETNQRYQDYGGVQNNPMDWFQNSTPLASTWTEVQAVDTTIPGQFSNALSSQASQLNENGKRRADMISSDDGMLVGDLSADQLNGLVRFTSG